MVMTDPQTTGEEIDYTDSEQRQLVREIKALTIPELKALIRPHGIPVSGTKTELLDRIEDALRAGNLSYANIVDYLDAISPWKAQHVYLYNGPASVGNWRDLEWGRQHLTSCGVGHLINAINRPFLPTGMQLTSIEHRHDRLRIMAVERREFYDRAAEHDRDAESLDDDAEIEYRAYKRIIHRGWVVFEWNFFSNTAMLQIAQLPSGDKYEDIALQFGTRISPILDMSAFEKINIRRVIRRLIEMEANDQAETRSHISTLQSRTGRRITASSATSSDNLLGDPIIDDAMQRVRADGGTDHLGNFYWLTGSENPAHNNPLETQVHVVLIGEKARVNLSKVNREEDVRYVLDRVRTLSE